MSATGDIINLSSLVLSDTYQTWMDRTNQIIASINPAQVYDVNVGTTGGLLKQTGISAGNYNGVVTISINPGPGVGARSLSGQTVASVDFANFSTYGLVGASGASGFYIQPGFEYIYNDTLDTTQSAAGTAKKVSARNMLPSQIDIPSGAAIRFNGNIIIGGSLVVNGSDSFSASANLNVQNKQIFVAYQESVGLFITGSTAGSFLPLAAGVTAYRFPDGTTTVSNATAVIQSYTGPAAGPTGTLVLGYPFGTNQSASTFVGVTGFISKGATGLVRFRILSDSGTTSAFLSDASLDQAGLVAKGASSDKSWLWEYLDPDSGLIYNAWTSNNNIAVDGNNNAVISRNFKSYGYTGNNFPQFIFTACTENPTKTPTIYLAEIVTSTNTFQNGGWAIQKDVSNNLVYSAFTGGNISSLITEFTIIPSATGATYPGVTVMNFAQGLNSDMVDGAHAYQGATAYSIPVSDDFGTVDGGWLNADAVRKVYTVTGHGFIVGDVLRITATGSFAKAVATDLANAEAVGMVSQVRSANKFAFTQRGIITGLSGPLNLIEGGQFSPGQIYFLAGTTAGRMTGDPDNNVATRLSAGQIRKAMYLSTTTTEGIVLNYLGTKVTNPTDTVYLSGIIPVGTIYPYAGSLANLTSEWIVCDGTRYKVNDYLDLYNAIGNVYYGQVTFATTGTNCTVIGGTKGILVGDVLQLTDSSNVVTTTTVLSVNTSTFVLGVDLSHTAGTYKVTPLNDVSSNALFFIPDLRTRQPLGGSTGSSYLANNLASYSIGTVGGAESVTLGISNIPQHTHGLSTTTTIAGAATTVVNGSGSSVQSGATGGSGGVAQPVDIHEPYLVIHYIIRALKGTGATILTGHDHDLRYIRYDAGHTGLVLGNRDQFRTNAKVAGVATGSSLTGDLHDHNLLYVRWDTASQGLTANGQYNARQNINASVRGEGDGLYGLGNGQTLHNHDSIYPRYDGSAQAAFTEGLRVPFVTNVLKTIDALNGSAMTGRLTGIQQNPVTDDEAASKYYVDNNTTKVYADVLSLTASATPAIVSYIPPNLKSFTTLMFSIKNVTTPAATIISQDGNIYTDSTLGGSQSFILRYNYTNVNDLFGTLTITRNLGGLSASFTGVGGSTRIQIPFMYMS